MLVKLPVFAISSVIRLTLVAITAIFLTGVLPTAGLAAGAANATKTGINSHATDAIESALAARGLIGPSGLASRGPSAITPPAGREVDESVQRNARTGTELLRVKSWKEPLGKNTLYIEITTTPTHQYEIAFWLMPRGEHGCKLFGWTLYSDSGTVLKSSFWRNDPGLKLAGAASFPSDLYPDTVPGIAFSRALGKLHPGAAAVLNQQLTPYSYVTQDVTVSGLERVTVPAGTFQAYRVTAQARVQSLLPSWPHFLLRVVQPFVPRNTLYFEAAGPHRLLKQDGTSSLGGPEVSLQLVNYYEAGAGSGSPAVKATPPGDSLAKTKLALRYGI